MAERLLSLDLLSCPLERGRERDVNIRTHRYLSGFARGPGVVYPVPRQGNGHRRRRTAANSARREALSARVVR
jgi:hypothetical protein